MLARLQESESRFRTMADSAPVLLWMAGLDAECDFFNQPWLEFTGRPLEAERGSGWAEGVHPEDFQHCMHTFLTAFVERKRFTMEYRLRRADGEYRWILDTGAPRFAPDGSFAGYVGSCIDITELKQLQHELDARVRDRTARLRAALAERDVLLHEVHHRVKNNLQVITSLLRLQARSASGGQVAAALAESQARVYSIALVHERLYRSEDLARVDLAAYARNLADNLSSLFAHGPDTVAIDVDVAGVQLPVDQAVPCGLILTELLTNALKYAFPEGRHGSIVIRARTEGAYLVLTVSDDGVGLPHDLDTRRASSLGLSLVGTLVGQLEGVLLIQGRVADTGTAFEVRFPIEPH
jgi:PAS domain S-box-containing protein